MYFVILLYNYDRNGRDRMKKIFENKSYLLIGILVIIVILAIIPLIIVVKNIFSGGSDTKKIERDEVMELYDNLSNVSCYNALTWSIDGKLETKDMEDSVLLDLIFRNLDKNGMLVDKVSLKDFEKAKEDILGKSFKELKVKDHEYGGYVYNAKGNKISGKEMTCSKDEYISVMNGYSNNDNKLIMNVNVGYVDGNKVYDLGDNELGEYSKEKLGDILSKGTGYKYIFDIEDDNYYLVSVENIEKKVIEKE